MLLNGVAVFGLPVQTLFGFKVGNKHGSDWIELETGTTKMAIHGLRAKGGEEDGKKSKGKGKH